MKNKIEIIFQNDHIIAVNKPTDISVTKDRSGDPGLLDILAVQNPAFENLRLIHRLDKATSGIMIVAKTPEAQSIYSSCFEKRLVEKTYLALVSGYVGCEKGRIKAPLANSLVNGRQMCVSSKRGKPAITDFRLLAEFGLVSLIAAMPVTGRTHQIRVHCLNRNIPLAIDPLYASSEPIMLSSFKAGYSVAKFKEEKPLIDRLTLHSYQLKLPKTELADEMTLVAKLDKKFAATIKMLTKHNPNGANAFLNLNDYDAIIEGKPL